ncbi:hypothetical protein AAG570_008304 [Ranatra chinensis]|uniref:Uncharacterized protein n=1 Tax=Ranatra chinensis TaxID=642074 RepID=A0ABD0XSS0_9HEMI
MGALREEVVGCSPVVDGQPREVQRAPTLCTTLRIYFMSIRNYAKSSSAMLGLNYCLATSSNPKMKEAFEEFEKMQIAEENSNVVNWPGTSDDTEGTAGCSSATKTQNRGKAELDKDRWIMCDICDREWPDGCPQHKLTVIQGRPVPVGPRRASRAVRTLLKVPVVLTSQTIQPLGGRKINLSAHKAM